MANPALPHAFDLVWTLVTVIGAVVIIGLAALPLFMVVRAATLSALRKHRAEISAAEPGDAAG